MKKALNIPTNELAGALRVLAYLNTVRWCGVMRSDAVNAASDFAARRPDLLLTVGVLDSLVESVYGK